MTIAVTGHRDVVMDERLLAALEAFFANVSSEYEHIVLLSALADGADQCVAKAALQYDNIELQVPLPMDEASYLESIADKEHFHTLAKSAKAVFTIPQRQEDPYTNLGHFLVECADVLLVLWDGTYNDKAGGTGEVLKYAKSVEKPIVHIAVTRAHN